MAPDAETQALANEIAHSGGIVEPANGRAPPSGRRERPTITGPDARLGAVASRSATPVAETTRLQWPCLLPSIAVAVAPLRNLTGDPEQQYLMEAFTDDLVTDLLRHGRGLSLARIADERRAADTPSRDRRLGNRVCRHRQRPAQPASKPFGSTCRSPMRRPRNTAGRAATKFDSAELEPVQTRITRQVSREVHALLLREASRRARDRGGVRARSQRMPGAGDERAQGQDASGIDRRGAALVSRGAGARSAKCRGADRSCRTCQHLVSAALVGRFAAPPRWLSISGRRRSTPPRRWRRITPSPIAIKGMLCSAGGQLEEAADGFRPGADDRSEVRRRPRSRRLQCRLSRPCRGNITGCRAGHAL